MERRGTRPARGWGALVVPVAVASVSACSAVLDFDALEGVPTLADDEAGAPDAARADGDVTTPPEGGLDGSVVADATVEEDVDAGPPPLYEQRFEGAGCNGWDGFQSTVSTDPAGRSGSACRVCMNAGVTDYFSVGSLGLGFLAEAGKYRVEAWVRTAPDAGVTSGGRLHLRHAQWDPFVALNGAMTPPEPFSTTWRRLEVTLDVTETRDELDIYVTGGAATNACFLVDDVKLHRVE